jgi:hypothetical protein
VKGAMGLPGYNEIRKRRRHFDKLMVMVKEPTLSKDQAALRVKVKIVYYYLRK